MRSSLRALFVFLVVIGAMAACINSDETRPTSNTAAGHIKRPQHGDAATIDNDDFFNKQFWRDSVVAVVAVGLGIPVGLFLNARIQQLAFQQKRADAEERRRQLAAAIRNALQANVGLVERTREQLTTTQSLSPSNSSRCVDLDLLDSTASMKYEVIGDIDSCRAIDAARFQLENFGSMYESLWLLQFENIPTDTKFGGTQAPWVRSKMGELGKSIVVHADTVLSACRIAMGALAPFEGTGIRR